MKDAARMQEQLKSRRAVAAPAMFVSCPSRPHREYCLIKPEQQVTAFIPLPIVQAGCRNPTCAQRLANRRASEARLPPEEDIEMFTRTALFSSFGRAAALASIAALALSAVEPSTAQAAAPAKGVSATSGTSDATDISAARRYYRGGGGAAAAAAFAGIVGTGLAIAASQDRGYYYGGPAYYGGGPYGGPPAYYGDGGYYGGGYGYRSGVPHYRGHPLAGW
jgi:hypothetical protein